VGEREKERKKENSEGSPLEEKAKGEEKNLKGDKSRKGIRGTDKEGEEEGEGKGEGGGKRRKKWKKGREKDRGRKGKVRVVDATGRLKRRGHPKRRNPLRYELPVGAIGPLGDYGDRARKGKRCGTVWKDHSEEEFPGDDTPGGSRWLSRERKEGGEKTNRAS
jgi:hypothetical protein